MNQAADYIKDCAKRASIQSKLKKTDATNPFRWTDYDTKVIRAIKEKITKVPELDLPNLDDFFIVKTDTSKEQWGAVYYAIHAKDRRRKLCKYKSGTFKDNENKYTAHEKELLAVIKDIEAYIFFLGPKPFMVVTDSTYAKIL